MSRTADQNTPSLQALLEDENRVMRKLLHSARQQLETMGSQLRAAEWARDGYKLTGEIGPTNGETLHVRKAEPDLPKDAKLQNQALHEALALTQFRIHALGGRLLFDQLDGRSLIAERRSPRPWQRLRHTLMLLAYEVLSLIGRQAGLIRQANAAREERNFSRAAGLYAKACASLPGHFRLWVQQGNMAKDAGLFLQAQNAYEHACSLYAHDGDVYLQMGHMFKMMGDSASAAQAYATSLMHAPDQPHAMRELDMMGYGEVANSIRAGARR